MVTSTTVWRTLACLVAALASLGGAAALASAHAIAPSAASTAFSVRVDASHLVNAAGETIRLVGVDRSGSEYECVHSSAVFDGPVTPKAISAMVAWHVNAVRVPLNEDCWLGINGADPGSSASRYRQVVERYVRDLEARRIYVILDLHWAAPGGHLADSQWPMADADHAPSFWRSVATTFASNHGLLFDLFNEPYITSWNCWKHGCTQSYDDNGTTVTYRTAGMQQLVNAVRSTGSTTPLMLGGLSWSSDEQGWLANEPTDPANQLVVSFHTYNFSGCNSEPCWQSTIAPLAKHVPVVTGEFGENGCADTYDLLYMPWADSHGISYLGWTWNSTGAPSHWDCSGGPALIVNYGGKPTAYGIGLKRHLAALAATRRRR